MKNTLILGLILNSTIGLAIEPKHPTDVLYELGSGSHVCVAQGVNEVPQVSRAESRLNARFEALKSCAEFEGSLASCEVECDKRDLEKGQSDKLFLVNNFGVLGLFMKDASQAEYECFVDFKDKKAYVAESDLDIEAEALAIRLCLNDGNSLETCQQVQCQNLDIEELKQDAKKLARDTIDTLEEGARSVVDLGGVLVDETMNGVFEAGRFLESLEQKNTFEQDYQSESIEM